MNTFRGMDTFSTSSVAEDLIDFLRYTLGMNKITSETKIVENHSEIEVDNVGINTNPDGTFELVLFHERKSTDGHVDEADIIGTWRFSSLRQLEDMKSYVEKSAKHQLGL